MQDTANRINQGTIISQYTDSSGKISENNETRQISEERSASVYVDESQLSLELPEISENSDIVEVSDYAEPEYPSEYKHVRSPEIRRSEQVILMSAAAVCGAVGGVLLALSGKFDIDPAVLQKLVDNTLSGFGSIFFQRVMLGALFLGIEYLLGFFALGDLLVWTAPLVYSLGTAFRVTALKSWILLPSAVVGTVAVVLGAALSSGFSHALMRLSSGGTVYLESSPKQKLAVSFLGCLAAVIAAAIYEGAILHG